MKKIYLIEDNAGMLSLLSNIFKEIECEIYTFQEAKEAYENFSTVKPDIILCDLYMPEYDGFRFLKEIKSNSSFKSIPVIVLSVASDKKIIDEVMQMGADHFFQKPFRVAELFSTIKNILGD
ncbi:MAG: response regulator [Melioribacteraceae bacterium]|nr:response regulator [Melioribacteraceae bacterium]